MWEDRMVYVNSLGQGFSNWGLQEGSRESVENWRKRLKFYN